MIDVLLVQPPVSFLSNKIRNDIIPNCPHLGLLYLAAGIERLGLKVKIIDAIDGSFTDKEIIDFIVRQKLKVIGISASTMNIRGAVQLAEKIKQNDLDMVVCLGGAHMTADTTIVNRFDCFDFGITGQADLTFPEIVRKIVYDKEISKGAISSVLPDNLDNLPFPANHLVDWDYYIRKRGLRTNTILASRGCPFNCIFCSIPSILRKHCVRSPELILEEMIKTYELNKINTFVFADDIFTLNRNHIIELCNVLRNSKIKFRWGAQTRPDLVDNNLLKEMKRAGCYKLLLGIESGNEEIRIKIIHKRITDAEIDRANELCWQNNIEPDWYLMLGFPSETKRKLYDTVNLPLKVRYQPNIIGVHITLPLPGSILFQEAMDTGAIDKNVIDNFIRGKLGEGFKDSWPYYIPKGLSIDDLKEARNIAYKKFYFRPSYILRRFKKDIYSLEELKNDLKQGWSLLRYGRSTDDK
jgi:radical SAM superfamily enzyme YgiQ (UPF0313 family)